MISQLKEHFKPEGKIENISQKMLPFFVNVCLDEAVSRLLAKKEENISPHYKMGFLYFLGEQ